MIYCQDCGAANDVAGTFCRICGQGLSAERSSQRCPMCSQPLAHQATFCSSCGATVMQARAAQSVNNFAFAGAAAESGNGMPSIAPPLNPAVQVINESLELPDWLKRAAAEQPHDVTQTTDNSFMYTGSNPTPPQPPVQTPPVQPAWQPPAPKPVQPYAVPQLQPSQQATAQAAPTVEPPLTYSPLQQPMAQPETPAPAAPGRTLWPSQVQPTPAAPVSLPQAQQAPPATPSQPRKLVSTEMSNGAVDQGMPSWLGQAPQASAAPSAPPVPQAAPPVAATDTTSFISESDLPVWIRQLAEAEEQRKVQEAAAAAAAAISAATSQPAPPEAPPDQNLFGEGSLAQRISQQPGEAEPPATTTNPWLNRHEIAEIPQADVWSRPKSDGDRKPPHEEVYAQPAPTAIAASLPGPAAFTAESVPAEASDDNNLRLYLLIAAAISVAALAAYLIMTGSL